MEICFIRHGKTQGNLEKRYLGRTDEPLCREGQVQLLEKLAKGSYPVAQKLIVSPMLRCRQTAQLLYPGNVQEICPGLEECDFGLFEYKNYEELKDVPAYQHWLESGGTAPFPNGESREAFSQRCCKAFEEVVNEAKAQQIPSLVFVVHGGTIMAILDRFFMPHRDYFDWQVSGGEGYRVICENSCDQPFILKDWTQIL